MPLGVITRPQPDPAPMQSGTAATGTTPAADLLEVAPNADEFAVGVVRIYEPSVLYGFKAVVSTVGTPGDADIVASLTAATRAVLGDSGPSTRRNATFSVPVWDCVSDPVYNPEVGTVIACDASAMATKLAPGQLLALYWDETGTAGTSGVRPKIRLLGWDIRKDA